MADRQVGTIRIYYYPREGGLERYIEANCDARDPTPDLEQALRTEALAAWESAGLIDVPIPEPQALR